MDFNERQSLLEQAIGGIPEYNDRLYLQGYKPYQILQAASNTLYKHTLAAKEKAQTDSEATEPMNVKVNVEVKKK